MVQIIKVSDEFFTEFDRWRENISQKNKMKNKLSRPEASNILRQLLPDIDVNIEILRSTKKKKLELDLNLRRSSR